MFDEEDDDFMIDEELIMKNCERYLNRLRTIYDNTGNKLSFKRGSPTIYTSATIQKFKPRKAPMNTFPVIHNITNEWFYKKFGIYGRVECLFVTNSTIEAKNYGTPHYVFPVGGFTTIHSRKVHDLFLEITSQHFKPYLVKYGITNNKNLLLSKDTLGKIYNEKPEELTMALYDFLETSDYVKGKSSDALHSNNEVMLRTDKFIMVPINDRFTEFLNEVVWN